MTVRRAVRLLAVLGAVGVGWLLLGARPRDVVLVYDLSSAPGATALDVEIRSGREVARRAQLRVRSGEQLRHPVRLRPGAYAIAWRAERRDAAPFSGERELVVTGDETIVLPLGP